MEIDQSNRDPLVILANAVSYLLAEWPGYVDWIAVDLLESLQRMIES